MSSSLILAGLGMAAVGFAGRYASRKMPDAAKQMEKAFQGLPKLDGQTWANSKYYRGGFEGKMTKREAALVLGVSPAAPAKRIKEAHKRIMLLNHPDKGGSPYLAAKINEAKDLMDK